MASTSSQSYSRPHMEGAISQAERLLAHMQRMHSHDLPNEMVALQSLLQLLAFEEAKNLTDEGREYLRRLQNSARRASDMVRLLKDMCRLNSHVCTSETIALAGLARELQGELQRLWPDRQLSFQWQWDAPSIVGDSRVYLNAIVELCKALIAGRANACTVQANSRRHGDVTALTFRIRELPSAPKTNIEATSTAPLERMEIILAREWLALCGADADVTCSDSAEAAFVIAVPNR